MSPSFSCDDFFDALVDDFLTRYRRGQHPTVEEYRERHPQFAKEIDDYFPALMVMEEFGSRPTQDRSATFQTTIPKQFGEFSLVREIGRGGMGIVYEAVQESLGRKVALKVLPEPYRVKGNALARFRREASAAARLHHTNIVPVFGFGEWHGIPYYAMQHIDGQGLDRVITDIRRLNGKAPQEEEPEDGCVVNNSAMHPSTVCLLDQAVVETVEVLQVSSSHLDSLSKNLQSKNSYFRNIASLGVQAAGALAHAHANGILHRDIKPSNMLLDIQGTLWIADFGLAKGGDSEDVTKTGELIGTLRYMAPERFRGEATNQSDIYAMGVTLYELLALEPAFPEKDQPKLLASILNKTPIRLRQIDPHIPADLQTIVEKAIASDPKDRYSSADTLAEDLRLFLLDRPILARKSKPRERLLRWCRRNPWIASLTAAIFVLLATVAVGSLLMNMRLNDALDASEGDRKRALNAETNLTQKLWEANLDRARAGRLSHQPGQRFYSLAAIAEAAKIKPTFELRNEAIACLALTDARKITTIRACHLGERGPFFSGDLTRYAYTHQDGSIWIYGPDNSHDVIDSVPGNGAFVENVMFTPDMSRLLIAQSVPAMRTRVWNLQHHKEERMLKGGFVTPVDEQGAVLCWIARSDGAVQQTDIITGTILNSWKIGAGWHGFALHPNGHLLAVSSDNENGIQLWNVKSGELTKIICPETRNSPIAWHPQGRLLAYVAPNYLIHLWNIEEGQLEAVLRGYKWVVTDLHFSPSGDLLASHGWDEMVRFWDPLAGRELLSVPNAVIASRFSQNINPLNREMIGLANDLWEIAHGSEACHTISGRAGGETFLSASFQPHGTLLALATRTGVLLINRGSKQLVATMPLGKVEQVSFSDDGRDLYSVAATRGLEGWPIESNQDLQALSKRKIGHSVLASTDVRPSGIAFDQSQQQIAVVEGCKDRVLVYGVIDLARPKAILGPHVGIGSCVFSHDGRWLITATALPPGGIHRSIKIWDLAEKKIVHELEVFGPTDLALSPNGRWLATGAPYEHALWEVGTWKRLCTWARSGGGSSRGKLAFSPDGRLLALAQNSMWVQLVDPVSGQGLANLMMPDAQRDCLLVFSPESDELFVGRDNLEGQLWNLRYIRQELVKLNLDWDQPPYEPQHATPTTQLKPLRIEMVKPLSP